LNDSYHVLSIDPGSRKGLGFAISRIDGEKMTVVHATTINVIQVCKIHGYADTMVSRLDAIQKIASRFIDDWDIKVVVIENCYFRHGLPQAYRALISVIMAIEEVSNRYFGVGSLVKLEASVIKASILVAGNSGDKSLVKDQLLKIDPCYLVLPHVQLYNLLDEHSVDAIAIGYALHCRRLKHEYSQAFHDPWGYRT
jgi:Holliday junction resolvasome RuvABC endonuclease subunit